VDLCKGTTIGVAVISLEKGLRAVALSMHGKINGHTPFVCLLYILYVQVGCVPPRDLLQTPKVLHRSVLGVQ
jgi:hypothetical protein